MMIDLLVTVEVEELHLILKMLQLEIKRKILQNMCLTADLLR
nr:MAG TPA: hypothetical protein [Caudoviricetes sp.]